MIYTIIITFFYKKFVYLINYLLIQYFKIIDIDYLNNILNSCKGEF